MLSVEGQNVRLAARLVGWRSRSSARNCSSRRSPSRWADDGLGRTRSDHCLGGGYRTAGEALAEKGIEDVEALAASSIDDVVDTLDVSMDEAQSIVTAAQAIVARKECGDRR